MSRCALLFNLVENMVRHVWDERFVGLSLVLSLLHVCLLVGALCRVHRYSRCWLSSLRKWIR